MPAVTFQKVIKITFLDSSCFGDAAPCCSCTSRVLCSMIFVFSAMWVVLHMVAAAFLSA